MAKPSKSQRTRRPRRAPEKKSARKNERVRARGLSEVDIVRAALSLIAARGVDELSMRSLAQELGVSAMAIYYYVPHKEALLERVALSLLERVPMPPAKSSEWESQLRGYAYATWEALSAYPGLSRIVLERPPLKAVGRTTLYVVSVMQAAGFDEEHAMLAAMSFHTQLSGLLAGHARRQKYMQLRPRKLPARVAAELADALQTMKAMFRVDAREWMEFSIETAIEGLRVQRDARSLRSVRRAKRA